MRSFSLVLVLLLGCRHRTHHGELAQTSPPRDAASGPTVIIEYPSTADAHYTDYAAPLYINPGAPPGTAGNGKAAPRNTAPDAGPRNIAPDAQ